MTVKRTSLRRRPNNNGPRRSWADRSRTKSKLSNESKARPIREIIEHEGSHGDCTQTFIKKIRKQIRPVAR